MGLLLLSFCSSSPPFSSLGDGDRDCDLAAGLGERDPDRDLDRCSCLESRLDLFSSLSWWLVLGERERDFEYDL